MQLSKRIKELAHMVTPHNRVADIGCDHAYTSIYLVRNRIAPNVIAMDINQGPIDRAKVNILKYGYENNIEVRKSDGLDKLSVNEVDTILIAGMGGGLIEQILSKREDIVSQVQELILQPQSEIQRVRRWIVEHDFSIVDENMMKEDGKYYVMIKAHRENKENHNKEMYFLNSEEHYYYGRILLEQRDPILLQYLQLERNQLYQIFNSIKEEHSESAIQRQQELQHKMELVNHGLEYYEKYKKG